jgi:hypothetical protein
MARFSEEEVQFFDAQDDIVSISDANGVADNPEVDSGPPLVEGLLRDFGYELWTRSPGSVRERRSKFIKWMELSLDQKNLENSVDGSSYEREDEINRMKDGGSSVSKSHGFMEDFFSSRLSMSCLSSMNSSEFGALVENSACDDRNDGVEVGLDQSVVSDESVNAAEVSSTSYQHEFGEEFEGTGMFESWTKRVKKSWLRKLRSMTCMMDVQQGESDKVRQCKKQRKELSALYMGQDIQAHEGPIFTMKFSPDGQYLASAGEDGIVRLWQVVEDERHNEIDIPEVDTSCIYFTVNDLSELTPLFMDKDKIRNVKTLKKTSDSACIIFPPKVFRLMEKPLHEFHGHGGEILDLSWSKNNVSECHNFSYFLS